MEYILKLYVTGKTVSSLRAIENLKIILNEPGLKGKCKSEVIDILEHSQLAEEERIIATPVLIKKSPLPVKKVIGDLSDKEKVLLALNLVNLEECV